MKITGTRSYILIEFNDRIVRIEGELTINTAFYASVASIKNWEPPYDKFAVTEQEKKR